MENGRIAMDSPSEQFKDNQGYQGVLSMTLRSGAKEKLPGCETRQEEVAFHLLNMWSVWNHQTR